MWNFRLLTQRYSQFWYFKKGSGTSFSTTFCAWLFKKNFFPCYILLTDRISLPDCISFLRYLTICLLQLFVIQFVTSETLKWHWVFYQVFLFLSCFPTWSKSQTKNLNISRTEVKSIFHHFKGLPVTWRNLQEIIIL